MTSARRVILVITGLLHFNLLTSCGNHRDGDADSEAFMFFQNATRRDPTELEKNQTVNVKGCTAFFVQNTAETSLLVSARHCFKGAITKWCKEDGLYTDNAGEKGRCVRVVAADARHDIAMFEVDGKYPLYNERALRLAAFAPKINTPLMMIGYPADKFRSAKLTTTENCWILSGSKSSPYGGALSDRSSLHNCSTYGGNSGGPMLQKGSEIALGLPFTYVPNDYHLRSAHDTNTAAHMAQMADFVATHRSALEAATVLIEESQPNPTP